MQCLATLARRICTPFRCDDTLVNPRLVMRQGRRSQDRLFDPQALTLASARISSQRMSMLGAASKGVADVRKLDRRLFCPLFDVYAPKQALKGSNINNLVGFCPLACGIGILQRRDVRLALASKAIDEA